MRIVGNTLILTAIVFGVLGVRSYLRDDRYAKSSVVAKASVISVQIEPNRWKNVDHVRLVLGYVRDGVKDSIANNFSDVYSDSRNRLTEERLRSATYYVRYVPKENRGQKIPDWVMVNQTGEFEGSYGRSSFGQMATFILLGFLMRMFGRRKRPSVKDSAT